MFVRGRGSCTLSSLPRKLSSGLSRVPSPRFCVDYVPFILICFKPDIASGISGRVFHKGHILAGYYGFNANISFTFQADKNLFAHPTHLRFGLGQYFGDFWVYLGINSFRQRISKIDGNRNLVYRHAKREKRDDFGTNLYDHADDYNCIAASNNPVFIYLVAKQSHGRKQKAFVTRWNAMTDGFRFLVEWCSACQLHRRSRWASCKKDRLSTRDSHLNLFPRLGKISRRSGETHRINFRLSAPCVSPSVSFFLISTNILVPRKSTNPKPIWNSQTTDIQRKRPVGSFTCLIHAIKAGVNSIARGIKCLMLWCLTRKFINTQPWNSASITNTTGRPKKMYRLTTSVWYLVITCRCRCFVFAFIAKELWCL